MSKHFTPPKNTNKNTPDISALEKERKDLYASGKNPKRLAEVNAKLDYLFYGIKTN